MELAGTTPTSLTAGHGLNVCNLLLHLADCALIAEGFAPKAMKYSSGDASSSNSNDNMLVVIDGGGEDEEEVEDVAEEQQAVSLSKIARWHLSFLLS